MFELLYLKINVRNVYTLNKKKKNVLIILILIVSVPRYRDLNRGL